MPKLYPLHLVFCSTIFLAVGCSSSHDSNSPPFRDNSGMDVSAQYDLRSDVQQIDTAQWDSLLVAHQGPDLWFTPDARGASFLEPGAVTVIKDRGVLKVKSVSDEGDHLVVTNGDVVLEDFIENGSVSITGQTQFNTPFEDSDSDLYVINNGASTDDTGTSDAGADDAGTGNTTGTQPTSVHLMDAPAPAASASPIKWDSWPKTIFNNVKDVFLDGWKVEKKVITGNGDDLQYDITLTKPTGNFAATIHVSGKINNLQSKFIAEIQNHLLNSQTSTIKTSGEADLSWTVTLNDGSVGYNKLLFPGATYPYQFSAGGIPMVLRVGTNFGVIIGATGKGSVTTGKVHVTYQTDGGFQIANAAADSDANGTGNATFDPDQGTLTVGPGYFGLVVTLPKIDIGVGVDKLFVAGAKFTNMATVIQGAEGAIGGSLCAATDTTLTGTISLLVDGNVWAKASSLGATITGALTGNTLKKNLWNPTWHHQPICM